MAFLGGTMWMAGFDRDEREVSANIALAQRWAPGAGFAWKRSEDGLVQREWAEVNLTHRLARWNLPHAQANVWLYGGIGSLRGRGLEGTRAVATPGFQVDYETTRLYLAAAGRLVRAEGGVRHDEAALRAGFSFHEAEYEQTQPWLVLEVERTRGYGEGTRAMPMLRLIDKDWFADIGWRRGSGLHLNLMVTY